MVGDTLAESLTLLRSRRFGTFWFASLLSNIGTWAQQVAQPWLLISLGASPFLIGLDSFALGAPVWLLTLLGGTLADRVDRRRVIGGFQSLQMLCPTLLMVLLLFGRVQPWMVICLSLVVGITDALSMPSFQSIVPSIVERSQIAHGLALNSTQFNLSRILGPALAGLLLAGVGAAGCFAVSAASYLPFIGVALWILPRGRPAPDGARSVPAWQALREAVRLLLTRPTVQGTLLTVFCSSLLCAQLLTFAPVLVKNAFQGGAGHFSMAVSAFGVGGLLGALLLLVLPAGQDRRRLCSHAALAYGLLLVAAALDPWFWALPVLLAAAGTAMGLSNISGNTLIQTGTEAELRGQAVSLYMLAMRGGLSLGSLLTGLSVSAFGVRQALLLNGLLAVLAQGAIARRWLRG